MFGSASYFVCLHTKVFSFCNTPVTFWLFLSFPSKHTIINHHPSRVKSRQSPSIGVPLVEAYGMVDMYIVLLFVSVVISSWSLHVVPSSHRDSPLQ